MTDTQIIELYWNRQETAISESHRKYGSYCRTVAFNILRQEQDSEECVSDTWLRAWDLIPPTRPTKLAQFFAKLTRNLAIDRFRASRAQKRGGGELELFLDELQECIPAVSDVENTVLAKELGRQVNRFLKGLPHREANVFIRRYFYTDSIADIAKQYGLTVNHATVILSRTRKKLLDFLNREDYAV